MVSVNFLQSHSLFGGLHETELGTVLPLMEKEEYGEGEWVVREGEQGDRFYFILEGRVEVLKETKKGDARNTYRLAELGPGSTFGEMELIDIQARSASVRALESMSALTLTNMNLYRLYQKDAAVYGRILLNLAREISRRLRQMNEKAGTLESACELLSRNPSPEEDPGEGD
mgnify:CR=1 FL=1